MIRDLMFYSKKVVEKGLVVGPGGNTSVRIGETMWISPSGFSLDNIAREDWVPVDIGTGRYEHPRLRPSSEVAMHLYIYRQRDDVHAVIHTHPPVTLGFLCSGYDEIPHLFPDYTVLMGNVPSIEYIVPCSEQLAQAVLKAMSDREHHALLMKNHGVITVGANVLEAYYRAELLEDAAKIYWIAKTVGQPRPLTVEEKQEILELEAEKYRQKLIRG